MTSLNRSEYLGTVKADGLLGACLVYLDGCYLWNYYSFCIDQSPIYILYHIQIWIGLFTPRATPPTITTTNNSSSHTSPGQQNPRNTKITGSFNKEPTLGLF